MSSLSQRIAAALANLHLPAVVAPPQSVSASEPPHHLDLDVRVASSVGVEIDRLEFRVDGPDRTLAELTAWADRLAARITYLMEPLVVLEVDPIGVEVELRSQAPTARGGLRSFYEARLNRSGRLWVVRQTFDPVSRTRRPAPFQLTAETLDRLTDDLVQTAP
jgi:hypothetical protein